MQDMETLFPGCKDLLKLHGISVQGQKSYRLRTAVDQRGNKHLTEMQKQVVASKILWATLNQLQNGL